jgi:hypothetical protein
MFASWGLISSPSPCYPRLTLQKSTEGPAPEICSKWRWVHRAIFFETGDSTIIKNILKILSYQNPRTSLFVKEVKDQRSFGRSFVHSALRIFYNYDFLQLDTVKKMCLFQKVCLISLSKADIFFWTQPNCYVRFLVNYNFEMSRTKSGLTNVLKKYLMTKKYFSVPKPFKIYQKYICYMYKWTTWQPWIKRILF